MEKIIFATQNTGKAREIHEIMGSYSPIVLTMEEASIQVEIVEDGASFTENALIKVRAIGAYPDAVILGDDSGLEIDFFNGEPGIYSARYLGRETPYSEKNRIILEKLNGVPDEKRGARFVCAIAAMLPNGETLHTQGIMEGRIAHEIQGEHGFGYDPIFFLPEYGMTSAQLLPEEKNAISHRGKALRSMLSLLKDMRYL
ncbi:MAG: RdgB/HAM1 family non-canonical purine NTP pyrophosphatase [Lachnospiraceae bacterium]|nr:RdgB/HAM1 family non-canonical purine NTP pyrophosphatase [Lachnospiraceae bacterium]